MSNKFKETAKKTFERISRMTVEERRARIADKDGLRAIVNELRMGEAFCAASKTLCVHHVWAPPAPVQAGMNQIWMQPLVSRPDCNDIIDAKAAESNDYGYALAA